MRDEDTRRQRSAVVRGGDTPPDTWIPSETSADSNRRAHAVRSGARLSDEQQGPSNGSARIPSTEAAAAQAWEPGKNLSSAEAVRPAMGLSGRDGRLAALENLVGLRELERPLRQLRKHDALPALPEKAWTVSELHVQKTESGSFPRRLFQAEEALKQVQQETSRVREESDQLLRTAREEAEAERERARAEGRTQAEEKIHNSLQTATAILTDAQAWRDRMLESSEQIVLSLVRDIAKTLFGEGLALEETVLRTAFERAMTEARAIGNLRIHVHPDDAMELGSNWWQKQQSTLGGQRIELVASEHVLRGGCFIEGEFGSVDARMETQVATVLKTLEGGGG